MYSFYFGSLIQTALYVISDGISSYLPDYHSLYFDNNPKMAIPKLNQIFMFLSGIGDTAEAKMKCLRVGAREGEVFIGIAAITPNDITSRIL